MRTRALLAAMAFIGVLSSPGQIKVVGYPYEVANFLDGPDTDTLRVFPFQGNVVTIPLPVRLGRAIFGPDGRSAFGINAPSKLAHIRQAPGLSKVEFNPIRISPVPGTTPFVIESFAFSARQDKLLISGGRTDANGRSCGVFEILLPVGTVRQVLKSDCRNQWAWDNLSLSPDGEQAVATVDSNAHRDAHLELIDLVHGTVRSLSAEFWIGVWSPDGKRIAVLGKRNHKLFLIDPADFSRRRGFGSTADIRPEWSPDSRYLALWKYRLFRCGISFDVDPPATFETLDIESGKRSTIGSSECQLFVGSTGWARSEIAR
jgi:hypothetical protein